MFHFTFRGLEEIGDIPRVIDFLARQDLGYPRYQDWVQRTEFELQTGYKTPFLAFDGHTLVADLIFQDHKTLPRVRELKNLRVHPDVRGRFFAAFLLRQAEVYQSGSFDTLLGDVREDQHAMLSVLRTAGYQPLFPLPLYSPDSNEVILAKTKTSLDSVISY